MPNNKIRRNSVVEMLAKVPVNRGSLLTSIENLLKTIESSESAVMIPTLLRDKCEFDAWELLFVAKILKASILGHSDLVEFYMNHIHNTSSQFVQQQQQQQQTNGDSSPSTARRASPASSPSGHINVNSPLENGISTNSTTTGTAASSQPQTNGHLPTSPSLLSSAGSISSATNSGNSLADRQLQQNPAGGRSSPKSQSTANSWATAASSHTNSSSVGSTGSTGSQSSVGSSNAQVTGDGSQVIYENNNINAPQETSTSPAAQSSVGNLESAPAGVSFSGSELPLTLSINRPQLAGHVRQAQPPSLLQLTTTNNHINSVVAASSHSFTSNNIEQLTNQLTAMQVNGCLPGGAAAHCNGQSAKTAGTPPSIDGALSISTTTAPTSNLQQQSGSPLSNHAHSIATNGGPTTPQQHPHAHELRTSRSAGCLFRMNSSSGASSPRTPAQTPTTPAAYPQAETLAGGPHHAPFAGCDPSTPVKLLLQIEQLKSSIKHVTSLLDSVVELYKKSIDNIALA